MRQRKYVSFLLIQAYIYALEIPLNARIFNVLTPFVLHIIMKKNIQGHQQVLC